MQYDRAMPTGESTPVAQDGERMLVDNYKPGFRARLYQKDLRIANEAAAANSVAFTAVKWAGSTAAAAALAALVVLFVLAGNPAKLKLPVALLVVVPASCPVPRLRTCTA